MTFAVCCSGSENGFACMDAATALEPVPLCTRHRMQVALSIVPEILASAAGSVAVKRVAVDRETAQMVQRARHGKPDLSGRHGPRVYFISNGGRLKIGYTTNLRTRLNALMLRADSVELFLDGGLGLEAALHRYFAGARIDRTEWFHRTPEVMAYVQEKAKRPILTVQAERPPLPPEAEVDLPTGELRALAVEHMGSARGVHLSCILAALHASGGPIAWRVGGLRRAYERHGFRVRKAIRVGEQVGVGLHRDDLTAPAIEGA